MRTKKENQFIQVTKRFFFITILILKKSTHYKNILMSFRLKLGKINLCGKQNKTEIKIKSYEVKQNC